MDYELASPQSQLKGAKSTQKPLHGGQSQLAFAALQLNQREQPTSLQGMTAMPAMHLRRAPVPPPPLPPRSLTHARSLSRSAAVSQASRLVLASPHITHAASPALSHQPLTTQHLVFGREILFFLLLTHAVPPSHRWRTSSQRDSPTLCAAHNYLRCQSPHVLLALPHFTLTIVLARTTGARCLDSPSSSVCNSPCYAAWSTPWSRKCVPGYGHGFKDCPECQGNAPSNTSGRRGGGARARAARARARVFATTRATLLTPPRGARSAKSATATGTTPARSASRACRRHRHPRRRRRRRRRSSLRPSPRRRPSPR